MEKSEQLSEKSLHDFSNSNYSSNDRSNTCKNLEATLCFRYASEVLDSIHRGKMEQIFLTYCLVAEGIFVFWFGA